jgi:hypothetical protein
MVVGRSIGSYPGVTLSHVDAHRCTRGGPLVGSGSRDSLDGVGPMGAELLLLATGGRTMLRDDAGPGCEALAHEHLAGRSIDPEEWRLDPARRCARALFARGIGWRRRRVRMICG